MALKDVPQEIWWLVCQDLQKQEDFNSIISSAQVCKSWAMLALPLLYSSHDQVNPDDGAATEKGRRKWAGMWRSIILSSTGVTAHPYCLWLKSLSLGSLEQLLQSVATDRDLRPRFFEGPMSPFEITSGPSKTRAQKPVVLEWQRIIEKVGDSITNFAKDAADKEDKTVQLTSLEGAYLPTPLLTVWTSRLSTLTTLTVTDGSVLTEEVGASLRDNCPAFKDLTCYNIRGSTVDENMSAFFRALKQQSLENFTVLGSNEIGFNAFEGLMQHSTSLKTLQLLSLHSTALPFLHVLTACPYLESLGIEASTPAPPVTWAVDNEDPLIEVANWLKCSTHLRKLSLRTLGGAAKLLAEALKSPDLRLKELDVKFVDDDEAFYTALAAQSDLESLYIRSMTEVNDGNGLRHDTFLASICACKKMKFLNIMQNEHLQLSPMDLTQMKESLLCLEFLQFDGEWLTDAIWQPLSEMPALSTITINGMSIFTYDEIRAFMLAVRETGPRPGFRLDVMNQQSEARITPAQEHKLSSLAARLFNGNFDFQYWRDPSEDEMSDFSD